MSRRKVDDALLGCVYHLSTIRPHEASGRGYTRDEWKVYCEGYYMALVSALRSMEFELRKIEMRASERRRQAAAARKTARASAQELPSVGGEVFGVTFDNVDQKIAQQREGPRWKYNAVTHLSVGVHTHEGDVPARSIAFSGPLDAVKGRRFHSSGQPTPEESTTSTRSVAGALSNCDGPSPPHGWGMHRVDVRPSGVPRDSSDRVERKTSKRTARVRRG